MIFPKFWEEQNFGKSRSGLVLDADRSEFHLIPAGWWWFSRERPVDLEHSRSSRVRSLPIDVIFASDLSGYSRFMTRTRPRD